MARSRVLTLCCAPVVVAVVAAPALFAACVRAPGGPSGPQITARWTDNFDRAQLGPDWSATSNDWTIQNGRLHVSNAHNHPLWLRRRLPRNARVEFDASSSGDAGDIKCEMYGDGHSQAIEASYTATSYVVIFGGWHNSLNVIARMDEHASNRQVRRGPRVVPGQTYHWLVERRGNVLSWSLDGQPMLEFNDDEPLAGPGHEYFAFNNWEVDLYFDNLVITPL
ncbi:MAG: hypothetical protein WCJ30_21120 [Deltaproteobacteria bacterium]